MASRAEKEKELTWLSRSTLQQLAKQHDVKANLKVTIRCTTPAPHPLPLPDPPNLRCSSFPPSAQTLELIQALLDRFPCQHHSPECLLVVSSTSELDETFSLTTPSPSSLPSSTPSSDDDNDPSEPSPHHRVVSQRDLKAASRRKTWHKADIQIGDRLLSPARNPSQPSPAGSRRQSIRASIGGGAVVEGEVGEFERAHTQPLMFSAVMEADGEESAAMDDAEPSHAMPSSTSPPPTSAAEAPGSPPFVGFITTTRRGRAPARESMRPSTRLSTLMATRRQTMSPSPSHAFTPSTASSSSSSSLSSSVPSWPSLTPAAPSTALSAQRPASSSSRRPLRPATSVLPPLAKPSAPRPRFDVAASLAKPVSWKMHRGPVQAAAPSHTRRPSASNPNGRTVKPRPSIDASQGKENDELKRRKAMRQKSIDYARQVRSTHLGTPTATAQH